MQDYESQMSEQDQGQQQQYAGLGKKPKRRSANEQIYGIFFDQMSQKDSKTSQKDKRNTHSYGQGSSRSASIGSHSSKFKMGSTIQTYTGQLEVNIPKSGKYQDRHKQKLQKKNQFDPLLGDFQKPQVGDFTLESFLDNVNENKKNRLFGGLLDKIDQEQEGSDWNVEKLEEKPKGLNDNIKKALKLKRIEEISSSQEQQQQITFQKYLKRQSKVQTKINPQRRKSKAQLQKQKQFEESYGKGYKMLAKMGFQNITKGLGKMQTGILAPVQAVKKDALTLKDTKKVQVSKEQKQSDQQQTKQKQSRNQFQELFGFVSKDRKINDFLEKLKLQYENLTSKTYFLAKEEQSFAKQIQINQNLIIEKQNQLTNLEEQITGLQSVSQNLDASIEIEKCTRFPHLAIQYKIDVLFAKKYYDKMVGSSLQRLFEVFQNDIINLKKRLRQFYISKQRETLKQYNKVTGIQQRIEKSFMRNQKKQIEVLQVSLQDNQKIINFVGVIIEDSVIPKIQEYAKKVILAKANPLRFISHSVIQLLESAKRQTFTDSTANPIEKFVISQIEPLIIKYLDNFQYGKLRDTQGQSQPQKNAPILPHLIVFPWFNLVKPSRIKYEKFLKNIIKGKHSLGNSYLFQLISPWIQFFDRDERHLFCNFYLAPKLLKQFEDFSHFQARKIILDLNDSNVKTKMASLALYCSLLQRSVVENILKDTIILQLVSAYKVAISKDRKNEINQNLRAWRRQLDKISIHFFDSELKQAGIDQK